MLRTSTNKLRSRAAAGLVLALSAVGLVVMVPAAEAAPDATRPYLEGVTTLGGSGCPSGSVGKSLAGDGRSATLIFDSFVAVGGSPVRTCDVALSFLVPAGARFLMTTDVRGYLNLIGGDDATLTSVHSSTDPRWSDNPDPQLPNSVEEGFAGPMFRDYLARQVRMPLIASDASNDNIPVTTTLRLTLDVGESTPGAQATIDSIDITLADSPVITLPLAEIASYGDPDTPLVGSSTAGTTLAYESIQPDICRIRTTGDDAPALQYVGVGFCTVRAYDGYVHKSVTVRVDPREVTVIPQPASAPYGVVPSVDYVIEGLVPGDVPATAPRCQSNTTAATPPGVYPEQSTCPGVADPRYNFLHQRGTVTITKAPVAITTTASSGLVSLLTLRMSFAATVKNAVTGGPAVGVPVTFAVTSSPKTRCTGVTDSDGVARCTSGPVSIVIGLFGSRYQVTTAETDRYLAGAAEGLAPLL